MFWRRKMSFYFSLSYLVDNMSIFGCPSVIRPLTEPIPDLENKEALATLCTVEREAFLESVDKLQ